MTGGCPITSYSIYLLDTDTQTYSEVDNSAVNNLPALRSHTIEFDSSVTGSSLTYYLMADNVIGSVQSQEFTYVLAAVPDQPQSVPELNKAETTKE